MKPCYKSKICYLKDVLKWQLCRMSLVFLEIAFRSRNFSDYPETRTWPTMVAEGCSYFPFLLSHHKTKSKVTPNIASNYLLRETDCTRIWKIECEKDEILKTATVKMRSKDQIYIYYIASGGKLGSTGHRFFSWT